MQSWNVKTKYQSTAHLISAEDDFVWLSRSFFEYPGCFCSLWIPCNYPDVSRCSERLSNNGTGVNQLRWSVIFSLSVWLFFVWVQIATAKKTQERFFKSGLLWGYTVIGHTTNMLWNNLILWALKGLTLIFQTWHATDLLIRLQFCGWNLAHPHGGCALTKIWCTIVSGCYFPLKWDSSWRLLAIIIRQVLSDTWRHQEARSNMIPNIEAGLKWQKIGGSFSYSGKIGSGVAQ